MEVEDKNVSKKKEVRLKNASQVLNDKIDLSLIV